MTEMTRTAAVALIDRERQKRATTYPKMLARSRKAFLKMFPDAGSLSSQRGDVFAFGFMKDQSAILDAQEKSLKIAKNIVGFDVGDFYEKGQALAELHRELAMRKKCYPRFVYLKRITPEVAERELTEWAALIDFFIENHIKND